MLSISHLSCRFKHIIALFIALSIALSFTPITHAAPVDWVNPFVGTDGTGHTFPGAAIPFGMVAPSPDMRDGGWDFTSGYQYQEKRLMGFSNTHMSGTGIPDLGDILLQPCSGNCWTNESKNFASDYDKKSETAHPGFYAVTLPQHQVKVELTATQRVAVQRYTFLAHKNTPSVAQVLADFQHGLQYGETARVIDSSVQVDAAKGEIVGTLHVKGWTDRQAAFVVKFSQPILRFEQLPAQKNEQAPRYILTFNLDKTHQITSRIALSTVDIEGARANLAEHINTPFATIKNAASAQWNSLLGRVDITAPTHQKKTFYTALYHSFLHPSDVADIDGRVRGPSGEIIHTKTGHYYSTLSLWDTFRAQSPLMTVLVPERVDGFIQTLINHHQQQGYLPLWTAWGQETWCMIGNPALPIMADAIAKGFNGFDTNAALKAMVETSTLPRKNVPDFAQHDWTNYIQYGYLPFDMEAGESISRALEYGVGDDAVARVAKQLGKSALAAQFNQRAQGYRKVFDAETKTMRGRDSHGQWRTPFNPITPTSPLNNPGDYTEANAYQYTLTPALHDPQGLTQLMGGAAALETWLDTFFSQKMPSENRDLGQEALIGQYAHGNEPSHHIAFLYNYTNTPWKGAARIAQIATEFYSDKPDGLIGNDDCGQMSAWYVFATLGLYPAVPASGEFVLGSPLIKDATLHLTNGKTLHISAPNAPQLGQKTAPNMFANQVFLNGKEIDKLHISYAALMQGGELKIAYAPIPLAK